MTDRGAAGALLLTADVDRLEPVQTLPLPCGRFLLSADKRTFVVSRANEVCVYRLSVD